MCVAKLSKFDLIYSQKFSYRNQVWALQCEIPQKTKPQPYVLSSLLSRLVRIVCLRPVAQAQHIKYTHGGSFVRLLNTASLGSFVTRQIISQE